MAETVEEAIKLMRAHQQERPSRRFVDRDGHILFPVIQDYGSGLVVNGPP